MRYIFKSFFFFGLLVLGSWNYLCKAQTTQLYTDTEIRSIQRDGKFYQTINYAIKRSKKGDAYQLMGTRRILGGVNELLKVKFDDNLISLQQRLIDAIFESAVPSDQLGSKAFNDEYMGWVSLTEGKSYLEEVPLYESYSFLYIAEFLYILQESGWADESKENKAWWREKVHFLERHGWEKWLTRSERKHKKRYAYFLRSRTHMGSHWAGVALYLDKISNNYVVRAQARELFYMYDKLLRRNFKVKDGRYIWNSTYDDVRGTHAVASPKSITQDVSHGNHVVSYIIAAIDVGNKNWGDRDIQLLINTLKSVLGASKKGEISTYVDGKSDHGDRTRYFLADGWVKLGRYDSELKWFLNQYAKETDKMSISHQEFQFKSNLLRVQN